MPNIALDDIISVQVTSAARQSVREGYNVGLIVGQSARIPQSVRVVEFADLNAMKDYGFYESDAEYMAAALYFGQAQQPSKVVVGIYCPANVSQNISPTAATGNTGATSPVVSSGDNTAAFVKAVGDKNGTYEFNYTSAWYTGSKLIGDKNALTAEYGISYTGTAASGDRITVGYTSGATAETWTQAIADCKDKNNSWYGVYCAAKIDGTTVTRLATSDHEAIASYVNTIKGCYFFDDNDDDDFENGTSDVFSSLVAAGYKRYCGIYSGTLFAGAAVMGYAMGANTGAANSAYSMAYKRLNGVTPDSLSESEIKVLQAKFANYYILRGGTFEVLEQGVSGYDGKYVDELIGVDQLTNDLQRACMGVLTSMPKVPYTDAGVLQFIAACNSVCDESVRQGFLSPGIWNGGNVLNLNTGDTMETGYIVQAESAFDQSAAQKAARICPPIYVCAILAGAIHSVVIKLDVE